MTAKKPTTRVLDQQIAQHRQHVAVLEAQRAAEATEQAAAKARRDALQAEMDARFPPRDYQAEYQAHRASMQRRDELDQQLKEIEAATPKPRMSLDEARAALARADRLGEAISTAERVEERTRVQQGEDRRVYDPAFRRSWDIGHPGGHDGCQCLGHRALRGEE
jgi:hypothetical protein